MLPFAKAILNISEKQLKARQIETLTFSLAKTDIQGIQFTLNFDPSLVEIIEIPTTSEMSEANFGTKFLNRGALTMSWDNAENTKEQLTFKLKIRANSATAVSELFTINSQFTKAEAYDEKGLLHEVGLAISESKYDYTLFQNEPNPFNQATTIRFSLPAKSQGKLTIFDITGQTLKSVEKRSTYQIKENNTKTIKKKKNRNFTLVLTFSKSNDKKRFPFPALNWLPIDLGGLCQYRFTHWWTKG